ncbi:hypothetical protein DUGA6_56930 [Duganella sp. HH105]|nr:hypothetical protein DUGA6_56930 [Duganella sp. HH105]
MFLGTLTEFITIRENKRMCLILKNNRLLYEKL